MNYIIKIFCINTNLNTNAIKGIKPINSINGVKFLRLVY